MNNSNKEIGSDYYIIHFLISFLAFSLSTKTVSRTNGQYIYLYLI